MSKKKKTRIVDWGVARYSSVFMKAFHVDVYLHTLLLFRDTTEIVDV